MKKANRICPVCGNGFYFCKSCMIDKDFPKWATSYDSKSCETVFTTCRDYTLKKISAAKALKVLTELDVLKDKAQYSEDIIIVMDAILKDAPTTADKAKETKEVKATEVKATKGTTDTKK